MVLVERSDFFFQDYISKSKLFAFVVSTTQPQRINSLNRRCCCSECLFSFFFFFELLLGFVFESFLTIIDSLVFFYLRLFCSNFSFAFQFLSSSFCSILSYFGIFNNIFIVKTKIRTFLRVGREHALTLLTSYQLLPCHNSIEEL